MRRFGGDGWNTVGVAVYGHFVVQASDVERYIDLREGPLYRPETTPTDHPRQHSDDHHHHQQELAYAARLQGGTRRCRGCVSHYLAFHQCFRCDSESPSGYVIPATFNQ